MKISNVKKKKRGSVLLLTFFILIFMALLGSAFLVLIPVEMRNAQFDRASVQTGYAADAGIRHVMNQLQLSRDTSLVSMDVQDAGNGNGDWQFQVENIEEISAEEFRVTTVGLLHGKVKRRAIAIIDDGSGEYALSFNADDVNATQTINNNGAWPADVPITGDVFVQGTWKVDNQGFDMSTPNANPPFQGTIFQTNPSGSALRGEDYVGSAPADASEYATLYSGGFDAVQPFSTAGIAQEDLLLQEQVNQSLLSKTFGIADGEDAVDEADSQGSGVYVRESSPGVMAGGVFFKPPNGGGPNSPNKKYDVRFSVDGNGNGVTTVDNNGTITVLTFITEGGSYGGETVSADTDKLHVSSGGAPIAGDFSDGNVIYIEGDIESLEGTHKGNHTLVSSGAMTITNELLKSDTPRGETPSASSKDALGLVATAAANNSSPGMSMDMGTPPADNEYYVYAYVTALSKTDGNAKMFSNNQHPDLPDDTSVTLVGSMVWAPTTPGQINTAMSFIEDSWTEVILDNEVPFGFPVRDSFIPRLRSYVDEPVG